MTYIKLLKGFLCNKMGVGCLVSREMFRGSILVLKILKTLNNIAEIGEYEHKIR